ncbi:hypothetical protein [Metallosphaera sp.]
MNKRISNDEKKLKEYCLKGAIKEELSNDEKKLKVNDLRYVFASFTK